MGTVRKILLSHTMIAKVVLTLSIASLATSLPQLFDPLPPPAPLTRVNENQVVASVITTLQPVIAAAVEQALRGSSVGSSQPTGNTAFAGSSATPAKYNYEYKVANDNTQTYIQQKEERDGLEVVGSYSYVDPQGAIVTVNYKAGEAGYQETRDRQEGAVNIRPQPASSASAGSGSSLDVDQLIAQVMAALQPSIQQAVSNILRRSG